MDAEKERELRAEAEREGVEPDDLIAAAEEVEAEEDEPATEGDGKKRSAGGKDGERPKLFQYHLPFLTVREVREFLGMTDPFPGDAKVAAEWALKYAPKSGAAPADEAPPEDEQ